VTDDIKKQQDEVNRQIDDVYNRLDELKSELKTINAELKDLEEVRQRYIIISDVSDQLEQLEKLGGSELFWGKGYSRDEVRGLLKSARDHVINYDTQVAGLQQRKREGEEATDSLAAKVNVLNDESIGLQAREEARAEEFIITREMIRHPFRPMRMPWNGDDEDQKHFRKILAIVLLFSIILGIVIPMWQIPVPDRIEVVEIPERLAKLIEPPPPPPPPKVQEKPKEEEPKADKPKKEEKKKPEPEKVKKARKTAEKAGLMAFKDDFADLIDDTPVSKLGAQAKISGSGSKAKKTTRSLVTSAAGSGSAGINTAALSRNVGGAGEGIGGVEFSRVESSIGTDFAGEERPLSSGPGPSRTDEEIQIVFDKYKAALYRIYNKELRKNPTLQGKMVLRLTIEPDGSVSACRVDSSDMDSPELDKKIADRVKRFNFGAKEGVPSITILYPIDFLPAT
jgi:TonB family protein